MKNTFNWFNAKYQNVCLISWDIKCVWKSCIFNISAFMGVFDWEDLMEMLEYCSSVSVQDY